MPGTFLPSVPRWVPAPGTKADLEYADLPIIDFAKLATPGGSAMLAQQVHDAMTTSGFFYVINHGHTQAKTDRMFDIGDVAFSQVSDQEKKAYEGNVKELGTYQGYKLRQYWHIDAGVKDQIEHYNINRDVTKREHPEALRPFLPEISEFTRFCHFQILHPVLRLLAIRLELPEDTFVNQFQFDAEGDTWVEDEEKTRNVWLKGHTDYTGITILWSQPVAALQIMSPDGKWRWAKHIDNAVIINAGEALEFLSGGYYKATIHRVVQPPEDQQGYPRLSLLYFVTPDDDVLLVPHAESPVLQRVGIKRRFEDADAPTSEQWRKGRSSRFGKVQHEKRADGHEQDVVHGIVVKHYN
ncbi:Clavaminate synthase-like protein [Rhodofomes roseus]|uniref:Clavaminate synthase-like protein n=1 Tax=Rhodofomes roseus TaxID=34475 RepID=A0ABQ8KCN1_9APHY|nr:Clavaminate synthase-like protein [Rhodofomes roseus]KAH9834791.1 Clavaminate synthase-like protein [Rhodofomes roseus]